MKMMYELFTKAVLFPLVLIFFSADFMMAADSNTATVREMIIVGNETTKEYVIRREIYTRPGDTFKAELLEEDRLRLLNLGLFTHVEFHIEPVNEDTVDILVFLEERFHWMPIPVVDYNSLDGWSFGGGIFHRNFRGRNETVGAFSSFGGATQYMFAFADPWITGNHVSFLSEIYRIERYNSYEDFHEVRHSAWGELGRKWGEYFWGRIKIGIDIVQSDVPGITLQSRFYDRLPFVQATMIYDTRDLYSNPSSGWRFTNITGQFGVPFKTPDYRLFTLTGARYLPIKWGRTLALGFLFGLKNGKLPSYCRYYLGGTETVRGLPGNYDRGNRILLLMSEYRVDIIPPIRILKHFDLGLGGTLFAESGSTWNGGESVLHARFHSSYGLGVRFLVPMVDVLRLDYAWTLEGHSEIEVAFDAKL